MTYLEKFRMGHPTYKNRDDEYIYRNKCVDSDNPCPRKPDTGHMFSCKECWNREIPENEVQKTEQPVNHDQMEEPVINLVVVAMEAVYSGLITFGVSKEKAHEIVITAMCDTISDKFDRKVGYGE